MFGAPAGWERPLWFARDESESRIRYSYGAQAWWPAAEREATAVRDGVALLELTPFTKVDVRGPDAVALLQRLCTRDIDIAPDRAVYTLMLNPRGGIEADVTVTRIDEGAFRVVSGAATRVKDLAWIDRQRRRAGLAAEAFDATSSEVVLGIAGPRSRELLQALTPADLSNEAWPFAASRRIELATASIRLTRLGFTGESGFELYVPVESAPAVYESIAGAGQALGLVHCGHLALDACRIEKGYRHWGHDIGPHDTPLEAGLGFAVAWDKPGGFIGRDALLARRRKGVERRLLAVRGCRRASAPAARRARLPPRNARGAHHVGWPWFPHRPVSLLRVRELRAGYAAERAARRRIRDRHRRRALPAPRTGAAGVRSARRPAAKLSGCAETPRCPVNHHLPVVHSGRVRRWRLVPALAPGRT